MPRTPQNAFYGVLSETGEELSESSSKSIYGRSTRSVSVLMCLEFPCQPKMRQNGVFSVFTPFFVRPRARARA